MDLLDLIQKKKDETEFSFREYIKEKHNAKEAQFLVWLLELVEDENSKIIPDIKWIVKEVKGIKGKIFIKIHLSEKIIKKYNLLP